MTTEDFIIELFCRIDDQMKDIAKHPQANLYPSEIVTLAVLFAIKGVGERALCHFKRLSYRVWEYFKARLAFTLAAFNLLVQWHGLKSDENGFIRLSIAEFSL